MSSKSTIILVIWRHRLNLSALRRKPDNVRLVVVGPSELVVDERSIDVIHHVEGPITTRDENHDALILKTRELCASLTASTQQDSQLPSKSICVFERTLQREVAQIRLEFEIEGLIPEQFDQLTHWRDVRTMCRRGGLSTLRCCSIGSMQGKPDVWVECANTQIGSYPMFLRPVYVEANCMHTLQIVNDAEDLRSWIRAGRNTAGISLTKCFQTRSQMTNYAGDYLIEECLQDGYEFIAICSSRSGLVGTFCSTDHRRTFYASVHSQQPYGIEYLSVDQTRDILPGVESFVMQSLKTPLFSKNLTQSLVFVKGFYQSHNAINFLGGSLELRRQSLAHLFAEAHGGRPWEVFAVESLFGFMCASNHSPSREFPSRIPTCRNGFSPSPPSSPVPSTMHFALVNFPNSEGMLLHQTVIPKRKSDMRVAWRVSEGEELLDADGMDENVLQLLLHNKKREELLADVKYFCESADIAIDKSCLVDKRNLCGRFISEVTTFAANSASGSRLSSGATPFLRSCTTAD